MSNPKTSQWASLFDTAFEIIEAVERGFELTPKQMGLTFGGGTAMMLQIGHRESYDVDLFVSDPQCLAYLNAIASDMDFSIGQSTYEGDGSKFLKIAFSERGGANDPDTRVIGEIDFIVAGRILDDYAKQTEIRGKELYLETVPEIIAKKVYYRGSHLQPRDVFDIAAACQAGYEKDVKEALREIPQETKVALKQLQTYSKDYVETIISELDIQDGFENLVNESYGLILGVLKQSLK